MSTIDRILSEFVDAWNAGRRPSAAEYLERVAPSERAALAEALDTWLAVAPTPPYDDAARAAIAGEPALRGALAAIGAPSGLWPSLLPALRARAGLAVREVAERLTRALGLTGEEQRTERYLERMEAGELDAARVSRRLLAALGSALGVSGRELAEAGDLGAAALRPAPAGGVLFRSGADADRERTFGEDLEALSRAALTPAPPAMDDVDRLFVGGRDA